MSFFSGLAFSDADAPALPKGEGEIADKWKIFPAILRTAETYPLQSGQKVPENTQRSKNIHVVYTACAVQASRCRKLCKGASHPAERDLCITERRKCYDFDTVVSVVWPDQSAGHLVDHRRAIPLILRKKRGDCCTSFGAAAPSSGVFRCGMPAGRRTSRPPDWLHC